MMIKMCLILIILNTQTNEQFMNYSVFEKPEFVPIIIACQSEAKDIGNLFKSYYPHYEVQSHFCATGGLGFYGKLYITCDPNNSLGKKKQEIEKVLKYLKKKGKL